MQQKEKHFELPKANKDMRQVFAYLLKARFIDREVIKHFAHEKLLYESEEHHNCVFVGVDKDGTPRHAHKRGTYTLANRLKVMLITATQDTAFTIQVQATEYMFLKLR